MTERLLQFIWQFQYFNKNELASVADENVQVIFPGQYNTNQGPDFTDAKIKIDNTVWAGTVELHIRTSDWEKHDHQNDSNYNNVILHVVWEDDGSRTDSYLDVPADKTEKSSVVQAAAPVLELKERVSKILLQRYEELMNSSAFIPCEKSIHSVRDITWKSWKERLLAERLLRKANIVETYLQQNNFHWEETFWWLLARNFGMKVNADAFEAVARSIPINILSKQKQQIHQLESLLMGQASLLDDKFEEDYPQLLQKEYQFQKTKHDIKPVPVPLLFLRMRPGNFPTVRLAQLAMLVHEAAHLFSKIKEADSVKDVKQWFDVTANDYWHYHYRFDETSAFKKKKLGDTMIDNIIINTVVPVLFAYGNYHSEQKYKDKALQWLEETAAESNSITKGFHKIGIENKNAYDSQGLIELKTQYCDRKMCLECGVGNYLLKVLDQK
jgi:Protein of unknown function (DUF2851)